MAEAKADLRWVSFQTRSLLEIRKIVVPSELVKSCKNIRAGESIYVNFREEHIHDALDWLRDQPESQPTGHVFEILKIFGYPVRSTRHESFRQLTHLPANGSNRRSHSRRNSHDSNNSNQGSRKRAKPHKGERRGPRDDHCEEAEYRKNQKVKKGVVLTQEHDKLLLKALAEAKEADTKPNYHLFSFAIPSELSTLTNPLKIHLSGRCKIDTLNFKNRDGQVIAYVKHYIHLGRGQLFLYTKDRSEGDAAGASEGVTIRDEAMASNYT